MVNRVQFYGQGPLQAIRQDARTNPRLQMAQAMMQQGSSIAPVQSWQEGLSRMLQSGVGGYFAGKEQEKLDKREKAYNEAMKQALMGATQGVQQPMPQGVQGPPQMLTGKAGLAQAAMQSGNADIMPMALQAQLDAQAQEDVLNRQDELYQRQVADKERLMRLGATLKPLVPGRDVPYPQEVQTQREATAAAGRPTWESSIDPNTGQPIQVNVKTGERKADPTAKPMTEGQANAALYADRMVEAEKILSDPDLLSEATDWAEVASSNVPLFGNMLVSDEYRKFDQARRNFINATLRRESGAAIAASEFENANKQYFPQPGDDEETLKQKEQNRKTALAGIARAAGPSYQMPSAGSGKRIVGGTGGNGGGNNTTVPHGVTPDEWSAMTPEEKALFQ